MADDEKGFIGSIRDWVNDALGVVQQMAPPDVALPFGIVAGLFLCLGVSPAGRFAAFITSVQESPKWLSGLGNELWWRGVLIGASIVALFVYLLIRGNTHKHITKRLGHILAADIRIETGLGDTEIQRKTCTVKLFPRMLTTWRKPAPQLIYVCTPDTDRRFPLNLEKDKKQYRGTCEESAFHDAIVHAMSTSQESTREVISFNGRRFVSVDIRNADGAYECSAIAICVGFRLEHDALRDGQLLDGAQFPQPLASKHRPAIV